MSSQKSFDARLGKFKNANTLIQSWADYNPTNQLIGKKPLNDFITEVEKANKGEENTKDTLDKARAARKPLCFVQKNPNPDCMQRRITRVYDYLKGELKEKHPTVLAIRTILRKMKPLYKGTESSKTFTIPKGNIPFSINEVIDQRKGKNTGKTTLHYHDSGDDNLITIEPGEEITIVSPSGIIIVTNRDMNKNGKLKLVVYSGKETEKSPSEKSFNSLTGQIDDMMERITKLVAEGFNYNPADPKILPN